VVVSVNPHDVTILLPAIFRFSKRLKVEKTTQANHYTQCTNCYWFGHASARCTQKHLTCSYCALHHSRSAHRYQTPPAPRAATPRPSPAAALPPYPTAQTVVTTTIPSPGNAGLDQSHFHNPRPPHLPMQNYLTPPPTVRKPWMWAIMATQHPQPPKPLQPQPSTIPPPDPANKPETSPPPPAFPVSTNWQGPAASNSFQTLGFVPEMIKKPCSTSRHGLTPATNLTPVQYNSLGSWDVFLSLFSSLMEGPPSGIVLLQDPPASRGFLPTFSVFKSIAPRVARPRVACYVSQNFVQKFAVLPFFPPERDDFMALNVFTPQGCCGTNFPHLKIRNTYARPLPP